MPDILANAGGVTASLISSGCRTAEGYFWKESVVNEQLQEHIMVSSRSRTWCRLCRDAHKVNNRIAAYMLAIDRVAYTIRQRGILRVERIERSVNANSGRK